MEHKKKHWMQGAVKHPGAETESAKRAGMPLHAYEEKHKHDAGTAGKRARFGLLGSRIAKHHAKHEHHEAY